jgi:wyosine [tRNA(Phe)-imidazoG37] synthetase (radical SAM superfamily)
MKLFGICRDNEYTGKLWIAIIMIKGLNNTNKVLKKIASAFEDVLPERIYLVPISLRRKVW